jgi:hypothetical protein
LCFVGHGASLLIVAVSIAYVETVALAVAGIVAIEIALWLGWSMYRQSSVAEKPEAGVLARSLFLYFCVAGTLLLILLALSWLLTLLDIL